MSQYTLKRRGQQGGQRSRTRTTEHNDNIFFYNDTSSLECPITFGIFYDPVIAEDGHTYEKWAILKWFENNNRSPKTNKPIGNCLISNTALKILIEQIKESQPDLFKYSDDFLKKAKLAKDIKLNTPNTIRNKLLNAIPHETPSAATNMASPPRGIRIRHSDLQAELDKILFSSPVYSTHHPASADA